MRCSSETPFIPEQQRQQFIVAFSRKPAETCLCSHDSRGTANGPAYKLAVFSVIADGASGRFDCNFKGLEIELTHSLFIGPGVNKACTACFRFIESKVLQIAYHAVIHCTGNSCSSHYAGQHRIFGIVFEYTTREHGTVQVDSR